MPPDPLEPWLRRLGVTPPFRALAALLPGVAVVVTDAGGRVVAWSPEAERLFGYTAAEVVGGRPPEGTLTGPEGPHAYGARVRARRKDGVPVHLTSYAHPFEADGAPAGAIHALVLETPAPAVVAAPDMEDFHGLVTRDPGMLRVLQVVRNVAETDATVLVRGESGTGKELVARAIHLESRRRAGPFVAVNCAAFSPSLLESELFGHVKGAFTGAVTHRRGIFAQADGGTLFLDEVAELPLELQPKLLRVLQERTFVPVGGAEAVEVDVRVIAATHRALREEARAGRFREDLLFRIRVVPLFLPPLRERRLDVDLLLRLFVDQFNRRGPRVVTGFAPEAMRALLDHRWPGNVRELRNVVEYAFAVGRGPSIGLDELPPELREPASPGAGGSPPGESDDVARALRAAGGDLERAAQLLGVSRTTFWRMRKRAGDSPGEPA